MDIEKNNILIAEFVNEQEEKNPSLYWFYDKRTGKSWHKEEDLLFHESWDWLMEAVEKMWDITGRRSLFYQDIFVKNGNDKIKITIYSGVNSDKKDLKPINETYNLIVNFITWYNHNKDTYIFNDKELFK